ncbi:Sir2 family NAD-dependent protein deacetylase [Stenotrophomonas lactitubi]|uniref:SIR2 family protein n=1 Tax=Stenotrophomonas lactitubi TaxID=2045214 RepID=UPI000C27868C|nr:SIR2 family protein [Stenotrophomonas lactitubi]PJO53990.1 Sir2 family NAD-dependent protein deacetylase [Stenotrophomonas lactitubi]
MRTELLEAHSSGKLILFVGAGVSANLGLPTWSELIARIAQELGYDPAVFATYGDHQTLAEFYRKKRGGLGELRSWMDVEWHKPSTNIKASDIHKHIAKGNFSRIYTTNYDRWIEIAHTEFGVKYDKIASVADMVAVRDGHRQIIKFHGDFATDESIVLDETSYYRRLSFDTPLDIKLRNDMLSNSILFIGYSLNDFNIRLLFYRLTEIWRLSPLASARPKSYVFTNRPNPAAEEVLRHWGIEMIVSDEDDPKTALTDFLKALVC